VNAIQRAASWAATKLIALAQWEGARQYSRDRGYIPGNIQDARLDLDKMSRTEMVRKTRYWEKNSGICNRCADIWEQYTVGPRGLVFTPATSSVEFNTLAAESWSRWSEFPDISSRMTLGQIQSLTAYRWFWDGEISILKTRGATGRPRIQLLECDRIADPDKNPNQSSTHDGVMVDQNGRPVSYFIRDKFSDASVREIPAEFLIRIYEPSRPNQLRGFPLLAPVLNVIQDLDELCTLEMRAAKSAARVVWGVNKKGGAFDPTTLRRERLSLTGATSSGTATTEARNNYLRDVLRGAETVALEEGEEMKLYTSSRPSVAVQEFWDHLISIVCAGCGIPRLLVLPKSMQGTVTRADLDVSAAFFRSRSAVLIDAYRKVYEYVIGTETQTNPRLAMLAPADWMRVNVRPPKSPNVDVGRNSSAMISELEAGVLTYETIMGDSGEDWRDYLRQRAIERRYIRDLAEEFDVDPQEIAGLKPVADIQKAEGSSQSSDAAPVALTA